VAGCPGLRIIPGNDTDSYLMKTLENLQQPGCRQMPPLPAALIPPGERSIVRQWIREGAPKN
jgi:hypothetical protein